MMHRPLTLGAVLAILSFCSAQIATITPCPACPATATVPLITVTAQNQLVSTCTPVTSCVTDPAANSVCTATPECTSFDYVSTVITNGGSVQTITATDQLVTLTSISTVVTASTPCPTATSGQVTTCSPGNSLQTLTEEDTVPYNNLGAFAIAGFPGSGLCDTCGPDADGNSFSRPSSTSSSSTAPLSTVTSASGGVNVFGITAVFNPQGGIFTNPATTFVQVTTSVDGPQTIIIFQYITITFYATAPGAQFLQSLPAGGNSLFDANGNFVMPNGLNLSPPTGGNNFPGFGNGINIFFGNGGGITINDGGITINIGGTPVTVTAQPSTTGLGASINYGLGGAPNTAMTTSSVAASAPSEIAGAELVGCFAGPATFVLSFEAGTLSNQLCISECEVAGFKYSGTSVTDCYCGNTLAGLTPVALDQCSTPCGGDPFTFCGGTLVSQAARMARRQQSQPVLLCYDNGSAGTPTTSTSATTTDDATSTANTPDPSSDPDVNPQRRRRFRREEEQMAKMAAMNRARGLTTGQAVRIGGQLRSKREVRAAPVLVNRRDFGLRQPMEFV